MVSMPSGKEVRFPEAIIGERGQVPRTSPQQQQHEIRSPGCVIIVNKRRDRVRRGKLRRSHRLRRPTGFRSRGKAEGPPAAATNSTLYPSKRIPRRGVIYWHPADGFVRILLLRLL